MLGRLPRELESVGGRDQAIELRSGNRHLARLLDWLKISFYVKDLTPPITLQDYDEMLAHIALEADEQREAIENARRD